MVTAYAVPNAMLQVLATAREGLKAASERAATAGRVLLEAHQGESAREARRLEEEQSRLRAQVAALEA